MKQQIKKLIGKSVRLSYKINGYHHTLVGYIISVSKDSFVFELIDYHPFSILYEHVTEIIEVNNEKANQKTISQAQI